MNLEFVINFVFLNHYLLNEILKVKIIHFVIVNKSLNEIFNLTISWN